MRANFPPHIRVEFALRGGYEGETVKEKQKKEGIGMTRKEKKRFKYIEKILAGNKKGNAKALNIFKKLEQKIQSFENEIEVLRKFNQKILKEADKAKDEIEFIKSRRKGGRPKYPEEKRSKIIELLEKKLSYRDISKVMKCSTRTVVQIAKENKRDDKDVQIVNEEWHSQQQSA